VPDETGGSARTFGVDAFVRFPTLRPEGATGSRSGSGKAGHDAVGAVWLFFNYTGCVKIFWVDFGVRHCRMGRYDGNYSFDADRP
jgi:hypothetical protein